MKIDKNFPRTGTAISSRASHISSDFLFVFELQACTEQTDTQTGKTRNVAYQEGWMETLIKWWSSVSMLRPVWTRS